MTEEELQLAIDQFLERHELSPTTFGIWFMNDSRFVFDLRAGRRCYSATIRKVLRQMDEYAAKQAAKRLRQAGQPPA
jgi:hypothetical protein